MDEVVAAVIKAVMISADPDRVFRTFLFFEKVVFSDTDFMRSLDPSTISDWNGFFQVMWATVAVQPLLLEKCLDLDLKTIPTSLSLDITERDVLVP
jgi:hypothetical protein